MDPGNELQPGTARRRPGRPRAEELDAVVMTAVSRIIANDEHVTIRRIVTESGVSRASVYRRWDTISELTAAALDKGRESIVVRADTDLKSAIMEAYLGDDSTDATAYGDIDKRVRRRLQLAMLDPKLQRAYWSAHVTRRRIPVAAALERGIRSGVLREDTDVEAAIDLIAGVLYYQLVARGVSVSDSSTRDRVRGAIEIVWRGIAR